MVKQNMPSTGRIAALLVFALLVPGQNSFGQESSSANAVRRDRIIWSDKPSTGEASKNWQNDGFPIGNGRFGAMIFGGVPKERIQFNVDSLWTGDQNLKGEYNTPGFGAYQNFGDVCIELDGGAGIEGYRRELDIENALCSVTYSRNGVNFQREVFCSHPDQIIAARYTADKQGQHNGRIRLVGAHNEITVADGNQMIFSGKLENGLDYEARLMVVAEGGELKAEGDALVFSGCNTLSLYLAADTSYIMDYAKKYMAEHPHKRVAGWIEQAAGKSFEDLKRAHREDYAKLYDRMNIDLGTTSPGQLALPMDQRLAKVRDDVADPDLEELLFQYGRYLLIACSRPGSLPANLQGLWNDSNKPRWLSDYHSNINLQMNYWGAEPANLAECHTPLFDMLNASLEPFRQGTRLEFGKDIRGFTIRTSHNPFGGMGWKWNIPASAWYARHYWEHYAFGGDKEFLAKVAYPYLKEVCHYWEDHLKELPDGRLVAPDGWSPEHGPREDGVAHDQQIIWDLFSNTIKAAQELGIDEDYRKTLTSLRDRLVGPKVGRWGQLQEWMEDRDDPKDQHRHTSQLYAVYPGYQISRVQTPEFAEAAAVSLKARGESGDSRREWAWTWRCALWARLGDAEMAHHMIRSFLKHNMLDNLIGVHPPLQLDGSLGITGSMCELLLQSHAGEIQLLPALPKAWANGQVKGLRARGGFTVDMAWKDGKLTSAVVRSQSKGDCVVRYRDKTVHLSLEKEGKADLDGQLTELALGQRMKWWEEARFALFIHWGAYSVLGGEYNGKKLEHAYAEQIQRIGKIPHEEYREIAASKFRPEKFNAEEWVKLAKAAGMKYLVITAKHHDGFAIYHSKHSTFDVGDAAGWERDPLKELSDACRKHGLKFGVYYSQSQDWHDVFDRSGDWNTPGNPASSPASQWSDPAKCGNAEANRKMFETYMRQKGIPQVVELIKDHGAGLIWFDTPAAYPLDYAPPFFEAVRKTDPSVVVNARIGAGLGDYEGGPDSPVVFPYTNDRYWEAIQSTLHSWGYNKFDEVSRRPTDYLLRMLATVVSKGGNMMINVGPKPDGTLVEKDIETLKAFADWSKDNIESIHGAGRSPLPVQNWGVVTRKDNDLYLHVFDWPADGQLRVGGLNTDVKSAELLAGRTTLDTRKQSEGVLAIHVPSRPSHSVDSVIKLHCAGPPEGDTHRLLEPGCGNRFHVTDTPFIKGKGLKRPIGVGHRAFLENWVDPEAEVVWKIRAAEKATYAVHFLYDLPQGNPGGNHYRIQIGEKQLASVDNDKNIGDEQLIEQEMALMRMNNRGRMVADCLGSLTLEPGVYDITLRAAGEIKGSALFLPRSVILVPES